MGLPSSSAETSSKHRQYPTPVVMIGERFPSNAPPGSQTSCSHTCPPGNSAETQGLIVSPLSRLPWCILKLQDDAGRRPLSFEHLKGWGANYQGQEPCLDSRNAVASSFNYRQPNSSRRFARVPESRNPRKHPFYHITPIHGWEFLTDAVSNGRGFETPVHVHVGQFFAYNTSPKETTISRLSHSTAF